MFGKVDATPKDDNENRQTNIPIDKQTLAIESNLNIKVEPRSSESARNSIISNLGDNIETIDDKKKQRRSTSKRPSDGRPLSSVSATRKSKLNYMENNVNLKDFIIKMKVSRDTITPIITPPNISNSDKEGVVKSSTSYTFSSYYTDSIIEVNKSIYKRNKLFCMDTSNADHGYAFFILIIVFFLTMLSSGGILSFAFLKVSLIDLTGYKSEFIAWIGSLFYLFTSMSGIFLGPVAQKYGVRLIVMCGSILITLACVLMFFITNLYVYYFAWGLTFGIGFGTFVVSTPLALSHWFIKRKSFAIGLAMSGLSISIFFWGKLFFIFEEEYGLRGTILLFGGIELNACVLAMFLIPGPNAVKPIAGVKKPTRKLPCNFSLFRQLHFVLFFFSYFLLMYAHMVPILYMREKCHHVELEDEDSAHLLSVMGITSGVLRPIIGVFADRPWFNKKLLFSLSIFLSGISAIMACFFETYVGLFFYVTLYGIASGGYMSLSMAVLSEIVRLDQLADAFGLALTAQGLSNFFGIPLTALLDVAFGEPSFCFLVAGSLKIISCILVLLTVK